MSPQAGLLIHSVPRADVFLISYHPKYDLAASQGHIHTHTRRDAEGVMHIHTVHPIDGSSPRVSAHSQNIHRERSDNALMRSQFGVGIVISHDDFFY